MVYWDWLIDFNNHQMCVYIQVMIFMELLSLNVVVSEILHTVNR